MRKFVGLFTVILLSFTLFIGSFANEFEIGEPNEKFNQTSHKERFEPTPVEDIVKSLSKRLSLTQEQSTNVEMILIESREKMDALRESDLKAREERQDARREIITVSDENVKNLLTSEQKEEFERMLQKREERREDRKENRSKRGGQNRDGRRK